MRVTSSETLLALLASTLETTIFPELQSEQAKATGAFVLSLIAELRKREQQTPELLSTAIDAGRALETAMRALLAAPPTEAPPSANDDDRRLPELIETHARLTTSIAALVAELQHARRHPAADQDVISAMLLRAAQWESQFGSQQRALPAPATPATPMGPLTHDIATRFLREQHDNDPALEVREFAAIPGGFGKQTTRLSVRRGDGSEQALIVRKMDPAGLMSSGMFRIEQEFHLLRSVSATGYPAPKPLYLGQNVAGVDADFYVMERLPGRVPGSYLGGMQRQPSEALVLDIAARLAALHQLPLKSLSDYIARYEDPALLTTTVSDCYAQRIETLRRYQLQEVAHLPSPYLGYLADWLLRNLPTDTRRPVLVHGDFNIHNLLVENDRISGVLDWECAGFGAPEQDLAYIQPHISQLIDWEQFLHHYETCAGYQVDRERLPYYMAFSMLPVSIAMNRGVHNVQSGATRDPRYAMIELAYGPQFMEMGIAGTLAH